MRFGELLDAAGTRVVRRSGDAEVTDVTIDSRRCGAGSCFVAVRGASQDGHEYIRSAVAAGCAAVVCEDARAVPPSVPHAVVDDTAEVAGRLAQAIRGWPAKRLACIGVTGTNGKTTVAHLAAAVLERSGRAPGMVGTITYETGRRAIAAQNTTPDAVRLAELTDEMVAAGRTHLVMEVSSHALDQRRAAGIDFAVAIFTNLSGDHLDYHGTLADYFAAKLRLFEQLAPDATAVINRDDPRGDAVAEATGARVVWYGLSGLADVRARINDIGAGGTRFDLICGEEEVPVATPLIGRHNVFNCLAAATACRAQGIPLPAVAAALESVHHIPGRLERVAIEAPYRVFVDYAHTDDALANVLGSLRPITAGRVIVAFGCGGDRDATKRPRMARVAERLADVVVVTSDNPRTERPDDIIAQIAAGLSESGRRSACVEPDRRTAIEIAIEQARPGDVVLIAGKGHEKYQIVGAERIDFDDVEVAEEAMRRRERAG